MLLISDPDFSKLLQGFGHGDAAGAGLGLAMVLLLLGVILVLCLVALAVGIFLTWMVSKVAAAVPPEHREVEPGQVWLLLIPCFNLVWNFFVFPKISRGLAKAIAARGLNDPGDAGEQIGLWFCICIAANIPLAALGQVPIVGIPFALGSMAAGIGGLVLYILWLVKAWDLKKELEAA